MKTFVVGLIGLAASAVSAEAALVCTTPSELKVLQSAALQQQLLVASSSCHMSEDYSRFLAVYRSRLAALDEALRAFFTSHPRGEDYSAYKVRLANNVSRRSLQDAQFCASAQKVFDLALDRRRERNGLAPEPPHLVETGYEGCRNVDDRLISAQAAVRPVPRPEILATAVPKHTPRPIVRVAADANQSTPQKHAVLLPKPAPQQLARVTPLAAMRSTAQPAKPYTTGGTASPDMAVAPTPKVVVAALPATRALSIDADDHAQPIESLQAPDRQYGAVERPQWRSVRSGRDTPVTTDHIPNAYRTGTVWMGDAGPERRPESAPLHDLSYGRRPPPEGYLVLAPNGRWVVVIGHQPRWVRD